MKITLLCLIILISLLSKNTFCMEFSKDIPNNTPYTLIALTKNKIEDYLIDETFDITLLKYVPEIVALQIVNDAPQESDTFAHKLAHSIAIAKRNNSSVIPLCKKLEALFPFITDFDKQGKDEETLLHILAQINYCPEAVDLMFKLIHTYKACINIPANTLNIMETAIFALNEKAVRMLHETTNGICNMERYPDRKCMVRMIEHGAEREEQGFEGNMHFFSFVKTLLPSFQNLYTHRYVLAPCCQQGHAMFYDHSSLKNPFLKRNNL